MKHKVGVILRDKRYLRLLQLILKGVSKPNDILKALEQEEPNIYSSKLSNRLANINGKYFNFVLDNKQKKKDLIRYHIDYQGITRFFFDYFFKKYTKKLSSWKELKYLVDYNNKDIHTKIQFYLNYQLIQNNYDGNLYSLFHTFLVEMYKHQNKQEIKYYEPFYNKLTEKEKSLIENKIDNKLKDSFSKLTFNQHKSVFTDMVFLMLSSLYIEDLLNNFTL